MSATSFIKIYSPSLKSKLIINNSLTLNIEEYQIRNHCKLSAIILLSIIATFFIYNASCVFAQTDSAALKLQEANRTFEQAFNAVIDAESEHANITSLLSQLNDAAELLSQAENAHRVGNNNLAITTADRVIQMSKQINSSAQSVKESAIVENQKALWIRNVSRIIITIIFVLIMFIVWRQFKQRYIHKKLDEKPEVINQ